MSKEKYLEKVSKQNRKKTDRCRMLSTFGLNIKTIERSEDCDRSPKKLDRMKEYLAREMLVKRNSTNDNTRTIRVKPRRNMSHIR